MIVLIKNEKNLKAFNIVYGALVRSFSSSLISVKSETDDLEEFGVIVFVDCAPQPQLNLSGKKTIIFGSLSNEFSEKYRLKEVSHFKHLNIECEEAKTYNFNESKAKIEFVSRLEPEFNKDFSKPTQRFDFLKEWNNLDYGFIDRSVSDWGIASNYLSPDYSQIAILLDGEGNKLSYISLLENENENILWVNRNVGLVDSHEWILIENYISDYRPEHLECLPVLRDIPWGHDTAITMRLDCDEDVSSAQALYESYKEENVPLSLALHTSILEAGTHDEFIKLFLNEGGCLLSHTHTHAPQWGGSYESALFEARTSKKVISERYKVEVEFAVCPFHHAPRYALEALKDSGYRGCVGGIAINDPEFIYARGGKVDGLGTFVGHSQQVMLHGDCLIESFEDPIDLYKKSFHRSYESLSFFGYLDHPFSERYSYGWKSENQRIKTHLELIRFIRSISKKPLFVDQITALNFMYDKSQVIFTKNKNGYSGHLSKLTNAHSLLPYFRYKGQDIKVELN